MEEAFLTKQDLKTALVDFGNELKGWLLGILDQRFSVVNQRFLEMDERLDDMAFMVKQGFDAVDEQFKGVDQRFNEMGKRFDHVEERLEIHSHQNKFLAKRISNLESRA